MVEINIKLKNYLEYLESKKEQEISAIKTALEECECCKSDRIQFYECLISQGKLTFRQIGILEGISKQAVHRYLKKGKSDKI